MLISKKLRKKAQTGLLASAVLCPLISLKAGLSQRAIPDDNLAYPVLITLGDGSSGSGFFYNAQNATYLVTARHVLYKEKQPQAISPQQPDHFELRSGTGQIISYSRDPASPRRNVFSLDLATLEKGASITRSPTKDVAVVKLFSRDEVAAVLPAATQSSDVKPSGSPASKPFSTRLLPGTTMLESAPEGFTGTAEESIKRLSEVLVGNDVIVFGYPGSIGLRNVPQIDYQRPLLRRGMVAGINEATKSIILDCPVYFGNSGGPALEIDRDGFKTSFRVIGVVTEYIPFNQTAGSETVGITLLENSGYSVVAPMDSVLELIK